MMHFEGIHFNNPCKWHRDNLRNSMMFIFLINSSSKRTMNEFIPIYITLGPWWLNEGRMLICCFRLLCESPLSTLIPYLEGKSCRSVVTVMRQQTCMATRNVLYQLPKANISLMYTCDGHISETSINPLTLKINNT